MTQDNLDAPNPSFDLISKTRSPVAREVLSPGAASALAMWIDSFNHPQNHTLLSGKGTEFSSQAAIVLPVSRIDTDRYDHGLLIIREVPGSAALRLTWAYPHQSGDNDASIWLQQFDFKRPSADSHLIIGRKPDKYDNVPQSVAYAQLRSGEDTFPTAISRASLDLTSTRSLRDSSSSQPDKTDVHYYPPSRLSIKSIGRSEANLVRSSSLSSPQAQELLDQLSSLK